MFFKKKDLDIQIFSAIRDRKNGEVIDVAVRRHCITSISNSNPSADEITISTGQVFVVKLAKDQTFDRVVNWWKTGTI